MKNPETLLRSENPTDGLEVAVSAFRYPSRARPRLWPVIAGFSTALAIGAATLRLSVTPAAASPLRLAIQALEEAPAAISTSETYWKGRWRKADMITTWQSGVKRRERSGGIIEFGFDGRVRWAIQWADRRAQVSPAKSAVQSDRIDDGLATLARYDKPAYRLTKTTEARGVTSVLIEARSSTVAMRHSILRLAESGRPLTWTFYDHANGGWIPGWREVWSYPASIPAATFKFRLPKGFRLVDLGAREKAPDLRQKERTGKVRR